MITAQLFRNSDHQYWGFRIQGHAGYAPEGEDDIVCAAVSVLALNTANSIEALTKVQPVCHMEDGEFSCEIAELRSGKQFPDAVLLLKSLVLGLQSIAETYGTQYLHVLTIQK